MAWTEAARKAALSSRKERPTTNSGVKGMKKGVRKPKHPIQAMAEHHYNHVVENAIDGGVNEPEEIHEALDYAHEKLKKVTDKKFHPHVDAAYRAVKSKGLE